MRSSTNYKAGARARHSIHCCHRHGVMLTHQYFLSGVKLGQASFCFKVTNFLMLTRYNFFMNFVRCITDAVHTLTCAIMLLNTDLHGCGGGSFRRMSCAEFIDNLADLNDGDHFPRETLKHLYHAIRTQPLQWAL